ncbi:hypothetical protein V5R04_01760 [Jonesiaceae bacterium BS-20]|uniref:Uncharacterized protein n=1 Tax=Jonesiaceae bacterium BS-20 TaxID=3120821 RepID=A0AAU7DY55_9MICO
MTFFVISALGMCVREIGQTALFSSGCYSLTSTYDANFLLAINRKCDLVTELTRKHVQAFFVHNLRWAAENLRKHNELATKRPHFAPDFWLPQWVKRAGAAKFYLAAP